MRSLIKTLHLHIRAKHPGILGYHEAIAIARSLGRKESNAERGLRPSESPEIETIYNERVIIGYRYRDEYLKCPDLYMS